MVWTSGFRSCYSTDALERVSQRLTILAEDGRSKLRSPTKTVGVNHFAIRSRVTTESPWHDELRLVTTSEVDGVLYTVIWTDRIGKNSNHFPQVGA